MPKRYDSSPEADTRASIRQAQVQPTVQPTPLSLDGRHRTHRAASRPGWPKVSIAIASVVGAAAVLLFVVYDTWYKPRSVFNPRMITAQFDRDPYADDFPQVPIEEIFSESNVKGFEAGDGLTIQFRIINDPRNKGLTTSEPFTLERAPSFGFDNRGRRNYVDAKRQEVKRYIARFQAPIPIHRSVEIGIDDTEGITNELRALVLSNLSDLQHELTSAKDTVTLFLFRLSDTDYLRYRIWTLEPATPVPELKQIVRDAVEGWLLKDTGIKPRSSLATGLFNHLKFNSGIHRRNIRIFADGMENYEATASFYEAIRSPEYLKKENWLRLDAKLSRLESFPDLSQADVTWYFVPWAWPTYRTVHVYWEHVLRDMTHARNVTIVY